MRKTWLNGLRGLLCAGALAPAVPALAQDGVADFYRGKSITFIVGAAPGAAYDLIARPLAAHMTRHIPGEPAIVVQNMPGAGSLIMINHLYNRAPRDGTAMGLPLNGVLLEQRLKLYEQGGGAVRFDLGKMSWVGSPSEQPQVLWTWRTAPFASFEDMREREILLGATSPTADNFLTPLLAQRLLGAKVKMVSGYKAVNDIFLAAERGEIHGNSTPLSSILLGKPDEFREGKIRVLAQFGERRLKEIPDAPTGMELAKDDEARKLLEFWALKFRAAYPIALPPDVPRARVEALQSAFDATMKDPEFTGLAARMGLDLSPTSGKDIEGIIARIDAVDDALVAKMRKAIEP
ncbi:MAG: efflux transporter protein [Hyphomicrobiales bacterium]|nr:efflux transporter protein [Hyphomicrobiales bacterium]